MIKDSEEESSCVLLVEHVLPVDILKIKNTWLSSSFTPLHTNINEKEKY